MIFFLTVLGITMLIAVFGFLVLKGITWKEFGIQVLVQIVIAGAAAGITSCANTYDTELWNGRVTNKYSEHVSCEHSYSCNCHQVCSGSGKNRSCSEHCDTCYEHSYDVSWRVITSNAEQITIARVNRRGDQEPARFTAVRIGEPTSREHSYDNYVKAAPDSLFRHQGLKEKYAASIPAYPGNVYDYYHVNRLATVGVNVPDAAQWNTDLMELNADLGRKKQVNMIVVLVKNLPDDYLYALEEAWIGAKKNDVVLLVNVDNDMKPQWAGVLCWTTNELFKVKLRDDVMNDPAVTREALMADLRTNVDGYFVRKPMSDFKYLESQIVPTTTEWIVTLIIGLLAAIGMTIFFEMNDVFDEEDYRTSRGTIFDSWSLKRGFTGQRMPWSKRIKRMFSRSKYGIPNYDDDDLNPLR